MTYRKTSPLSSPPARPLPTQCEIKAAALVGDSVEETPDLISESLRQLQQQLEEVPANLREDWDEANKKCPELVGAEHRLLFLRHENFHVELAALRILRYWTKRVQLFGSTKAFEAMTMDGALRDDLVALSHGSLIWTGAHDEWGRGIFFENFQNTFSFYIELILQYKERETHDGKPKKCFQDIVGSRALRRKLRYSLARVTWYIFHVALEEDEQVRTAGAVYISRARPYPFFLLWDKDLKEDQGSLFIDMLRGCLPIKIATFHVCQPTFAFRIALRWLYAPRAQGPLLDTSALVVHTSNSTSRIRKTLSTKHGIPVTSIPSALGGTLTYNHHATISDLHEREQQKANGLFSS